MARRYSAAVTVVTLLVLSGSAPPAATRAPVRAGAHRVAFTPKPARARIGWGTTSVDLNVNRDLFNRALEWRQEPNPGELHDGQRLVGRPVFGARERPGNVARETLAMLRRSTTPQAFRTIAWENIQRLRRLPGA